MQFFSNAVFRLNTLNPIPPANTPYLQPVYNDLMAQKILSEMITYLGILRSTIYSLLLTKQEIEPTLEGAFGTYDAYKSYDKEFEVKAPPEVFAQYQNILSNTELKPTVDYIDSVFRNYAFDNSLTAATWWKASDDGVNELQLFQSQVWKGLDDKMNELTSKGKDSRDLTLVLLILALALAIAVIVYMVFIISQTLKELKLAAVRIAEGETGVPVNIYSRDMVGALAKSISTIDRSNKALSAAAMEIGNGNFSVNVKPRSAKDELGNAVIQMQTKLKQYSNKMEQLVDQRTTELARSNDDLQQFAHVASHDMKEPLRKIATFSNMLITEHSQALNEKGKIYLEKIESAAKRMAIMIEGVLSYSTLSATEDVKELIDLNQIITEVENDLELPIINKGAKITYDNLPPIMGIKLLVYQVFYNVINNSLKFSRDAVPPLIHIAARKVSKEDHPFLADKNQPFVQVDISDNGIGFHQDYAEQMFGVFSRLNSKDKYEGTGLGLALCKKIVMRHGGTIWAEGKENDGAVMHILLPAAI
jgi:signal transduction histidine kinase